ncbi:MAG TPA: bifunctional 23S rRNA (guanine(2069)-N(7))-methyltransferase RlmK/23S rRNA (guanine(2445)-N(2))-methyltransferase RlmL, partial [Pirellulales bacterium]|nr:bifunctional 23S rRNA (guanine(2069)-N(7))-methyltransferase RlmK/23S rRNA (guanine(2445)-N(2))-methyltransferase RlmL [Pirellulales bacterium]
VRLGAFEATDFGQLFDRTYALPWEQWLGADAAFPVNGRSVKSQLSSVPACQKIVKKAIVEKLKSVYGGVWLEETGPLYTAEVALLDDIATLTLDTSGAGLHKRGYRTLVGEAQLKETMAAALVMLSFWRPDRQLVDPFCGSGTIPIEAALIGRNMAPGLNRSFAAESWPAISAAFWEAAREEARESIEPDLPLRIIGTDNSEEALSLARYHAEQAGVAEQIHFQQRDFHDLTSKKEHGCVICNPPYGERLGDHDELEDLYRSMPTVLRRLKTWSHYILTAYPDFESLVGRKADRRRKLYNARIECTYYQFYGPKPGTYLAPDAVQPREEDGREEGNAERGAEPSASGGRQPPGLDAECGLRSSEERGAEASASGGRQPPGLDAEHGLEQGKQKTRVATPRPAFGGLSAKSREQGELFGRRLTARARHLRRWPKRGVTCYRLYDRDIPEVPLAVDRYEDCLHIAEYERPHDRSPGEHADWLDLMARTAAKVLEVPPANVFMKRRERQRGTSQYERFAEAGHTLDVDEGGLKFRVNLSDYLDTGLFLDHRITRSMVRDAAAGKRFLNLFGYTGSFTVYAASGEAATTTTVDLSNTYLQWAQDNLHLNGLLSRRHRFVRDDALSFLKFHPPGLAYDLAVVDPPTFSNSKKTDDVWDIQHDHAELLNRLVDLMAPGGVIFFSTNSRRFKLAESELRRLAIREISRQTVPEDFRNQRIHRCWRMTVGDTA